MPLNKAKLNQDIFYTFEVVEITKSQPLSFNKIRSIVFEDWEKFKRIEKIESAIKSNNTNLNFLKKLEKDFSNKIENYSIISSNTILPKELTMKIFKNKHLVHFSILLLILLCYYAYTTLYIKEGHKIDKQWKGN